MHIVYLTKWKDEPLVISDEGYEQISELIVQYLICEKCQQPYSEDNPQVGKNVCLACVCQREELTYAGIHGSDNRVHTFLDAEGYVFLSKNGYSEKPLKDMYETLTHWGFAVPETYTYSQQEIQLYRSEWKIYGDFTTASVVVAENDHYYSPKFTAVFLCYKGGMYKELSKRNGETKQLLQKAREMVEMTKDQEGYHVGKYATHSIFDAQVYAVVSMMESAIHEVQLRLCSIKSAANAAAETEADEAVAS